MCVRICTKVKNMPIQNGNLQEQNCGCLILKKAEPCLHLSTSFRTLNYSESILDLMKKNKSSEGCQQGLDI
ncbi:hypothetical protein Avbf_04467 [Armadillidium vulgare]|nr:hypothetical protein Avbf_04467 [Armadillidium vulgare]